MNEILNKQSLQPAPIQQGSEAWQKLRLGCATASRMSDVLATLKYGQEAAARRAYRAELVAERLTGCPAEPFVNAAMKWGAEAEPLARAAYEAEKGVLVEEVAFIAHPAIPMSGASPDGMVGADGMIEIKCPNTVTHLEYLINNAVPAEYHAQMLWQMECADRAWCDFVSFDPRLPHELQLFVMRFHRDDAKLAILREAVVKFLREVDGMIEELRQISAAA